MQDIYRGQRASMGQSQVDTGGCVKPVLGLCTQWWWRWCLSKIKQKCVTANLTMDSSRVLYADYRFFTTGFWDIIGQNDEKGHMDLFSSPIRK